MRLRTFMRQYCSDDREVLGELLKKSPVTIWRWLDDGGYNVIHKDGKVVKVVQTKTVFTCEGYYE